MWKRIGSILRFSYDDSGCVGLDSTCFATGTNLPYLVCVLNSKIGHYLLKDAPKTGTGDLLISVQAIEPLKIPLVTDTVSYVDWLYEILNGSLSAEEKVFTLLADSYGFNQEERDYILTQ